MKTWRLEFIAENPPLLLLSRLLTPESRIAPALEESSYERTNFLRDQAPTSKKITKMGRSMILEQQMIFRKSHGRPHHLRGVMIIFPDLFYYTYSLGGCSVVLITLDLI